MAELGGKVSVVTGAASGIGRAIAQRCTQEGMIVVLADVDQDALLQTEEALKAEGATVLSIVTDVSRYEDVEALAQKTHDTFGAVHFLFNNAGVVLPSGSIWESTLNDWRWIMGVNLWGAIHGTLAFIPRMLAQDTECYVVFTASSAGITSSSVIGPYGVTKHGIVSLAETLSLQLAERQTKIHVSVLCPGYVNTRLWDSERNRPVELRNAPGAVLLDADSNIARARQRSKFDEAFPPDQVVDQAFRAIRQGNFYILVDPETKSGVRERMETILQDRVPETTLS